MKKFIGVALAAAAIVCLTAFVAVAADAPAEGIKMNAMGGKTPVVFNHANHKAYDCKECHHKWDGSSAMQPCSAAGCHDVMDRKDKTSKSYFFIIHERKKAKLSTCLSCHSEVATKENKKEMTGCKKSACHP